ncbi:MAG: ATP-dependent helicase, partial [Chloroflexota bacterium]
MEEKTTFRPRPSQQKILDTLLNADGPIRLGVSAVPGSGKTHILSYLASELIQRVDDEQEVLIVTLVNAAVDNFRRRVDGFVQEKGLLPGFNYRVCTLHSLAHDIVRQRPSLVGLSQDFTIVDDRTAVRILQEVVDSWLGQHVETIQDYILGEANFDRLLRQNIPQLVMTIAQNFIKRAKDRRIAPHELEDAYRQRRNPLPLARLGIDIYREYQNRLARTGVDFDDLIRLAAQSIELDPDFLTRLQQRWPYILEDEAQDSSLLQEHILDSLAGTQGSWVRVGDPNQAIYETFTTADPENLRAYLKRNGVISLPMPESGRSALSIISLANAMIDWTMDEHPQTEIRNSLGVPHIEPTPPDDPQANPPDVEQPIYFHDKKLRPQQEIQTVTRSAKRWLAKNPQKTVAILDARNKRGVDVANVLRRIDVPYVELLNSTAATRSTAGVLGNVLKYLSRPEDPKQLATLFHVWKRHQWDLEDFRPIYEWIEQALQNCAQPEDYLWPRPGQDWLENQSEIILPSASNSATSTTTEEDEADEEDALDPAKLVHNLLLEFKVLVRRWQEAAILPIDQLILLLAQDLFDKPAELALAHKFAVLLRRTGIEQPHYRLPEF